MTIKSDSETLEDRKHLAKIIESYEYIYKEHWFMPEPFSYYLAHALILDGVPPDDVPSTGAFTDLFFKVFKDFKNRAGEPADPTFHIEQIPQDQFTEVLKMIFPGQSQIYVHPNTFVPIAGEWILRIADDLIPSLSPTDSEYQDDICSAPGIAFGLWSRNLPLTRSLIDGFFKIVGLFSEIAEESSILKNGSGPAEAYFSALDEKLGDQNALREFSNRGAAFKSSLEQARIAIDKGFFIEATVLCECVISRILNENIVNAGGTTKTHLQSLVDDFRSLFASSEEDEKVIQQLHFLRKRRNHAVHGFVTSQIHSGPEALEELVNQLKVTAKLGLEIAEWFIVWHGKNFQYFLMPRT